MKVEITKLNKVAFYQEGPGVRKTQFTEVGVKLINVTNISFGKLDLSRTKTHISKEEAFGKYRHFLLEPNDIVMASSGATWGKTTMVTEEDLPLCMNTSVIRFRSLDENILNRKYLKIVLDSSEFKRQIKKLITGSAQPNFGPTHLDKVTIPLPSLTEQKHIAEILSKAEALIAERKQSIQLLDEYLKSTFLEMFGDPVKNEKGWEFVRFKDLAKVDRIQVTPEQIKNDDFYIGLEDIEKNTGEIIKTSTANADDLKSSKFRFNNSHVLYAKLRPYLNKVALPKTDGICSTDIYPILPIENISNKYFICYFMRSDYFCNEMNNKATGANLPRANASAIENQKAYSPPFKIQNQFATIVEKTETLKTQYKGHLQSLEQMYGVLSQRAFRGELK